jgi:uncharacterized DUF497 family protein
MPKKRAKKWAKRCRQIRRSDAEVVWDDPENPRGNRQHIQANGLSEREVESVLLNDDSKVVANRSYPEHCLVFGYSDEQRLIAVVFEILEISPPAVRPITAFEPSQ